MSFWIPGRGRAWSKVSSLSLPVRAYDGRRLASRSRLTSGLENLKLGLALRKQPGLIHFNDPFCYAALRHGIGLAGLRTVVHVQLEYDPKGLQWAFRHPPDLIVTCAAFLEPTVRRILPRGRGEQQRIAVVPNAVDIATFCPTDKTRAKRAIGAPLDRPLVLMLANLAEHKGQETAIRAVRELKMRGVPVCAWLAGAEREPGRGYASALLALIESLGLEDDVHLLGFREDAPSLLRAADVMLLPSTNEGLPLSVVEAQAAKVPVIASPTAGVPEVIEDGVSGFLVGANDVLGYAGRIEQILRNPVECQTIIEAAHRRVTAAHDWAEYKGRMWELYCGLLTPSSP